MRVVVRDNNISKAFRVLKKKLYNEGIIRELADRRYYEKPSDKRRRKKKISKHRQKRALSKFSD